MDSTLVEYQTHPAHSESVYELTINTLYQEDCIRDIKQQIEAIYGVKLNRALSDTQLVFACKNGSIKSNPEENRAHQNSARKAQKCKFRINFERELRGDQPTYRLRHLYLEHNSNCIDDEFAAFLKNRRELCLHTGAITKIVTAMKIQDEEGDTPLSILPIVCNQMNLTQDFIYRGLEDPEYKRKLKKKYDNTIADARKVATNEYVNFPNNFWETVLEKNIEKQTSLQQIIEKKTSEAQKKIKNSKSCKAKYIDFRGLTQNFENNEQICKNLTMLPTIPYDEVQKGIQGRKRRKIDHRNQQNDLESSLISGSSLTSMSNSLVQFSQIGSQIVNETSIIQSKSQMMDEALEKQLDTPNSTMVTIKQTSQVQIDSRLESRVSITENQLNSEKGKGTQKLRSAKQNKNKLLIL